MNEIGNNLISETCTILQAIDALNNQKEDSMTLFVNNHNGKLLGTITDGDIRRAISRGARLETCICDVMNKQYCYLSEGKTSVELFHQFKLKGVELLPVINNEGHIIKLYNLSELNSLLPVDAVLMAGGKGERLRPLTEVTPKPLLKIGDKAIIDYNVERLQSFGVEHISVTINYLANQLEDHFKSSHKNLVVNTIKEPCFLGTIGAVKLIKDYYNDTVLLMNSDLFTNINYEDFYVHFKMHNADMSVAAVPYCVSVPYGIFDLDGRNILGIIEKPSYNYYANAGIYLIKRELLELIPDNTFYNTTDFINLLIDLKRKIIRFPITGYWIDIGKPADYHRAQELVKHIK